MGRAFRYQRRLAHIIVTVAEKKPLASINAAADSTATPVAKRTTKKAAARPAAKKAAVKKTAAKKTAAKKAGK
jgi:large subunit ribosomal protein L22